MGLVEQKLGEKEKHLPSARVIVFEPSWRILLSLPFHFLLCACLPVSFSAWTMKNHCSDHFFLGKEHSSVFSLLPMRSEVTKNFIKAY
jgi:hypothetical protein